MTSFATFKPISRTYLRSLLQSEYSAQNLFLPLLMLLSSFLQVDSEREEPRFPAIFMLNPLPYAQNLPLSALERDFSYCSL